MMQVRSAATMNVISDQTVRTVTALMASTVGTMKVVAAMYAEVLRTVTDIHVIRTLIVARSSLAVMEHVCPAVITIRQIQVIRLWPFLA